MPKSIWDIQIERKRIKDKDYGKDEKSNYSKNVKHLIYTLFFPFKVISWPIVFDYDYYGL